MSLLLRLPLAVVIFALWVLPGCVLAQASQSVAFAAADSPVSEAFPNVVTPDPWYYNVQENPVVGAGSRVRSLFKFNLNDFLPSIPAGAVVSAATLRLKATDQSDNNYAIDFFPTGDGWQQSTVTWNNRPAAGPTSMGRNPASGYTSHGNWAQLNLAFGAPGVAEVQAQLDGDRTLSFEATCATSTQNKGCSWMSLTANAGTKNTDWPRLTILWTPNPTTGATTGETTGATTGATTGQTTGARPPATTGAESAPPTSTSTSSTGTSSSLTSSSSSGSGVSITTSGSATTTGSGKVVSADSAAGSGSSESPLVLILVIIGAAAFCCLLLGLVLFVRARKNAANSSSSLVEDNGGSGDNGEVATYDVDKDNDEQVVTYASVTHLMESDSSISVDLSEEEDDVVEYASLAAFKEVATTP